jgi:hypothetical protein
MKAAGANIERYPTITYSYAEIRAQFVWRIKGTLEMSVMFTRNATAASQLRTRFIRLAYSFGATMKEAKAAVIQDANVVWTNSNIPGPTAQQSALVKNCLR